MMNYLKPTSLLNCYLIGSQLLINDPVNPEDPPKMSLLLKEAIKDYFLLHNPYADKLLCILRSYEKQVENGKVFKDPKRVETCFDSFSTSVKNLERAKSYIRTNFETWPDKTILTLSAIALPGIPLSLEESFYINMEWIPKAEAVNIIRYLTTSDRSHDHLAAFEVIIGKAINE